MPKSHKSLLMIFPQYYCDMLIKICKTFPSPGVEMSC